MDILYLICVIVVVFLLITSVWYGIYFYYLYDLPIPGPAMYPLIGHAYIGRNPQNVTQRLEEIFQQYGKLVKFIIGYFSIIVIADPDFMEFLLSSNKLIRKSAVYKFSKIWIGEGLATSDGEKWHRMRKLLTPAYHFKILENFIGVYEDNANILINILDSKVGDSFDICQYFKMCALDILCETTMGITINAQTDKRSSYTCATQAVKRGMFERFCSPIQHIPFLYKLTPSYNQLMKNLAILHDSHKLWIKTRREKLIKEAQLSQKQVESFGIKQRKVFLDLLLESTINGEPLSDAEIKDEVDTSMFAGHDSASNTMNFVLYCLSNYPDIQEKVLEEQHLIFGDDPNRQMTYNDLQEMKYLEMVIKETLRLYPPVMYFGREVAETMEYNGMRLKKGLQIFLYPYDMHRNPKLYPNPEKFDPERFTLENQNVRHPFSYLPFSAGPRNCIAKKFAMHEVKAVISKVIRRFKLLPLIPAHKVELVNELTIKSKNGIFLRLERRNN